MHFYLLASAFCHHNISPQVLIYIYIFLIYKYFWQGVCQQLDDVQKPEQEEKTGIRESVADVPTPHLVENARHNYTVDDGNPQRLKLTAGMADKPVQRISLKEKLEAFKSKVSGTEKQEKYKEKGKEITM